MFRPNVLSEIAISPDRGRKEWLLANRQGSFAFGSIDRIPRRKYYSCLTLRNLPSGEPLNTLLDISEELQSQDGELEKPSLHEFSLDVSHAVRWIYTFPTFKLERTLQIAENSDAIKFVYRLIQGAPKSGDLLRLSPLLLVRPWHSLTYENKEIHSAIAASESGVRLQPYPGVPELAFIWTGKGIGVETYFHWSKNIFHETERERGYPDTEDAFIPFHCSVKLSHLAESPLSITFGIAENLEAAAFSKTQPTQNRQRRKTSFSGRLDQAAEAYFARTREGFHSIIAGYPWFGHWARDAMVSLPGLCLCRGLHGEAFHILESYARLWVKQENSSPPPLGINSTGVDSPLFFIRALEALAKNAPSPKWQQLMPLVLSIFDSFMEGRFYSCQIHAGLLEIPMSNQAPTWMDVVWDGKPLTGRHGFPIEVNALFLTGLQFALDWARKSEPNFYDRWEAIFAAGVKRFFQSYWLPEQKYFADTLSRSSTSLELRPNQLWAIASAELLGIPRDPCVQALDSIDRYLKTPAGIRTLSPDHPNYRGTCQGGPFERDHAYHQGTVWPWLLGVWGDAVESILGLEQLRTQATPILMRLEEHMNGEACIGQIAEIFDGDYPHLPRGAPAQAWSIAETIRVVQKVKSL